MTWIEIKYELEHVILYSKVWASAWLLCVFCFVLFLLVHTLSFVPPYHCRVTHITYQGETIAVFYDGEIVYWVDKEDLP